MKKFAIISAAVAALLAGTVQASAAEITGTLNLGGFGVFYDNRCTDCAGPGTTSTLAIIDFLPAPGDGFFTVTAATGYFAALGLQGGIPPPPPSGFGFVEDFTNDATAAGVLYAPGLPAGGTNFLHSFSDGLLNALPLHYDVLGFLPQSGPDCATTPVDGCVASGIFKLTDAGIGQGVNVAFNVFGFFVNGLDTGFYSGQFGAEFESAGNVTTMLLAIRAGNDIFCSDGPQGLGCSWSATFSPIVPEPATLLLFGTGAAFLAARRRRKVTA